MSIRQCNVSVLVHYCWCVTVRNFKIVPAVEVTVCASEKQGLAIPSFMMTKVWLRANFVLQKHV